MSQKKSSLEDDIAAAFERACREQDFMVAEYLLHALEAIARRNGDDIAVHRAYRELIRTLPHKH